MLIFPVFVNPRTDPPPAPPCSEYEFLPSTQLLCSQSLTDSSTRRHHSNSFEINTFHTLFSAMGVYESVWQHDVCLGGILVRYIAHLFLLGSSWPGSPDLPYAAHLRGGLSRHMRVRFNAVVASKNSAATFPSPRMRNRRIPRCSFKIPMTGSATAFRR